MRPPEHAVLNALFLAPGSSGGPETYLRGLAPALAAEFPRLRLTIVTTTSGAAFLAELGFGDFAQLLALRCEDGQRVRRTLAEQIVLPAVARRSGAQLIHSLASTAPVWPRMPAVITLHDATFLRIRTFGTATTVGMRLIVTGAARRADALVTASIASRDEVCEALSLDPARFFVVPHGFGREARAQPPAAQEIRARHRLEGARVVLCVGAKRPHKNQELLVRALAHLEPETIVVLVGHAEPYEELLRELAAQLGVGERVRFVGSVSDAELEGLWRVTDCFAFPTLGEGFGLPVLEALAHGVAVACSDLAVLREVGGDLPVFFDPRSAHDAARAIRVALDDPLRAARGPARAAQFSWARAARGTHLAYERALAGA